MGQESGCTVRSIFWIAWQAWQHCQPALSCLLASRTGETAMLAGWRATVVMVGSHFPMVKHGTAGARTAGLSIP